MPELLRTTESTRAASGKRARMSLLEVAAELERRLPLVKVDAVAADALADEVRRKILADAGREAVADAADVTDAADATRLRGVPTHQAGVRLWNLVVRLVRDGGSAATTTLDVVDTSTVTPSSNNNKSDTNNTTTTSPYARLLRHGRVFAFLAIHAGTTPTTSTLSTGAVQTSTLAHLLYLLDIAIRAARACINEDDSELSHVVLEKAVRYVQQAKDLLAQMDASEDAARQKTKFEKQEARYVILKIAQFRKENRLQDADQLYDDDRTRSLMESADAATATEFSSTLFDIGKTLVSKQDFLGAITWLDRAKKAAPEKGQGPSLSAWLKELRWAIMYTLTVATLSVGTPDGYKQAAELVQSLLDEAGEDDARVQLVQLGLLASSSAGTFDADAYANVLRRMVQGFDGSDAAFRLLQHHIQKLHTKSPGLGCKVLDEFLLALRHKDATEAIEKLIIMRVWLLAQQREAQEELDAAERVLSKLRMPISANTAVGAQTIIWKRIEQGYQEKQYTMAARWCRLALCHVFEAGGRANRALIERKLLLCSIESGDLEAAKAIHAAMSAATLDEPMTKYILFKLSIKKNDLEMAIECLRSISTSVNGRELLYACIHHARHAKAPRFTAQALKKLADTTGHGNPTSIHTPALFRCIILMLRDIIDGGGSHKNDSGNEVYSQPDQDKASRDLADIFEGVVEAAETSHDCGTGTETPVFPKDELEWFCRAAYTLGLRYSGQWDLRLTVRILTACTRIINLFPAGQELPVTTDTVHKMLTCHFLVASALAALARRPAPPTPPEQVLRDYHVMREHIRAFQTKLKQPGQSSEKGTASSDFLSKLGVLLIFDFEGAIGLGDWDELENICEQAVVCQNADTFRVLGDCLLRSQAQVPSKKFVSTMRLIVQKLRDTGTFGGDKLIKYYRCLFQAALYRDNNAAFQVLEEVCHTVPENTVASTGDDWPDDELQFLAVTAFNEGIDWFAGGREDQARQWALSATRLAGRCRDGGKLKGQIRERFALLQLGDLEVKPSVEVEMAADEPDISSALPSEAMEE
ncbi:Meiosis specific protein SPO22 [Niveomyces insectorum RCEF 264]|uniref:Meiosis specific protein SPO22 n=1 Tax=Niveomyces insectorum RCEF 264 TaxID=1081102 RepID=A0A167NRL1_9HYPO|nr:Meiosis specific protein SPO22 [Niveomyces insectorum RCEF 264]